MGAHNFSFVSNPTPRHFLLFLPIMRRVVEQRSSVGSVCDMSVVCGVWCVVCVVCVVCDMSVEAV